ncbi:uncharacterized protein LOC141518954 [Macrotis lagotis]|uniref:uncharacterized protein LOC141518954 n=1 Tax=Macrotis lagotis TaxID=92651 RepID=UPI003D689016
MQRARKELRRSLSGLSAGGARFLPGKPRRELHFPGGQRKRTDSMPGRNGKRVKDREIGCCGPRQRPEARPAAAGPLGPPGAPGPPRGSAPGGGAPRPLPARARGRPSGDVRGPRPGPRCSPEPRRAGRQAGPWPPCLPRATPACPAPPKRAFGAAFEGPLRPRSCDAGAEVSSRGALGKAFPLPGSRRPASVSWAPWLPGKSAAARPGTPGSCPGEPAGPECERRWCF